MHGLSSVPPTIRRAKRSQWSSLHDAYLLSTSEPANLFSLYSNTLLEILAKQTSNRTKCVHDEHRRLSKSLQRITRAISDGNFHPTIVSCGCLPIDASPSCPDERRIDLFRTNGISISSDARKRSCENFVRTSGFAGNVVGDLPRMPDGGVYQLRLLPQPTIIVHHLSFQYRWPE